MKKYLFIYILTFSLFISCNKKNDNNATVVEYQMTSIERQDIAVLMTYNNDIGSSVSGNYLSGWKQSVSPTNKPYSAYLRATYPTVCSGCILTVNIKILVNGTVVKEVTGFISRSTPSADYFQEIQYVVN